MVEMKIFRSSSVGKTEMPLQSNDARKSYYCIDHQCYYDLFEKVNNFQI